MLRLLSYLAPSIPHAFYELLARELGADVQFEEAISGPLAGDDEPFSRGAADVGFVCSPSLRFINATERVVDLLPLPVPLDPRAGGRPVYFADVVVRAGSPAGTFDELQGGRWGYNDRNSKSGWFSMLERIAPHPPESYFEAVVPSGSHLQSLELVGRGAVDAAAIDSNVLALHRHLHPGLRVLQSWGPFPIQPAVIRASLPDAEKVRITNALLTLHERQPELLTRYGVKRFVFGDEANYA